MSASCEGQYPRIVRAKVTERYCSVLTGLQTPLVFVAMQTQKYCATLSVADAYLGNCLSRRRPLVSTAPKTV